jgi:hypothetical protein
MNSKHYVLGVLISLFLILAAMPFYQYRGVVSEFKSHSRDISVSSVIPEHGSVLFFPYFSIQKQILKSFHSFSKATLYPILGNGFYLGIETVNRRPEANLDQNWCLDSSGSIFRCQEDPKKLLKISLPMRLWTNSEKIKLLFMIKDLQNISYLQLSGIHLDSKGNWSFYTRSGIRVKLGSARNMNEKLRLLKPIFLVIQHEKMAVADVNVSVPQMPVLLRAGKRPRGSGFVK